MLEEIKKYLEEYKESRKTFYSSAIVGAFTGLIIGIFFTFIRLTESERWINLMSYEIFPFIIYLFVTSVLLYILYLIGKLLIYFLISKEKKDLTSFRINYFAGIYSTTLVTGIILLSGKLRFVFSLFVLLVYAPFEYLAVVGKKDSKIFLVLCMFFDKLFLSLKKVYVFLPFILLIIAYFVVRDLFKSVFLSFSVIFGFAKIRLVIITFIYGLVFVASCFGLWKYLLLGWKGFLTEIREYRYNCWFVMTIIIMLTSFFVGSFTIFVLQDNIIIENDGIHFSDLYNLDSVLWQVIDGKPAYQTADVSLDCSDQTGHFEVGRLITCNITGIKFKSYNATVTQYLTSNGSIDETSIFPLEKQAITFTANKNTDLIVFKIQGLTVDGKSASFETTREFTFPTSDQIISKGGGVSHLIEGLAAAVLFSIPLLMINLRNLYRNKDE